MWLDVVYYWNVALFLFFSLWPATHLWMATHQLRTYDIHVIRLEWLVLTCTFNQSCNTNSAHISKAVLLQTGQFPHERNRIERAVRYQTGKAMLVSHVSCDSSQCCGIWWERVWRVMQWGAPYSIGFLHVSWKPVGFKSMLIAKACHMSPDCEWWRKGGLKCSLIKRCAAHVNQ